MKNEKTIPEQLKEKLWKVPEVTDLRDMIFKSAERYGKKGAFELRGKDDKLYNVSYEQVKNDVVSFGTALIEKGLTREGHWINSAKIAILG